MTVLADMPGTRAAPWPAAGERRQIATPRVRAIAARLLVFAVIALLAAAIRLTSLGDAIHDYDEQFYHLVGTEMLKGHLPYVDVWDRKPIGLFILFALAALASGGSIIGYQAMAAAAAAIGACQTYAIGRRFGDSFAAFAAAVMYLAAFPLFAAPVAQSEVFYMPLLLAMLHLTLQAGDSDQPGEVRKAALWAMALGGIALQIKYTVLPQCLVLGVVLLWRLHRLGMPPVRLVRTALAFAALGLAPTLAVAAAYGLAGHFHDFFYANFVSIFSRGILDGPSADMQVRWIAEFGIGFVVAAAIGLLLVATRVRPVQGGYWVTGLFVLASVVGMVMVGNTYIHYFLPIVPGLLMLAIPAASRNWLCRIIAFVALIYALSFSQFNGDGAQAKVNRREMPILIEALRPYVNQTDRCLYVFEGSPAIYPLSGACLATRFAFPDHLNSTLESDSIGTDQALEMRRLFARRPGAVVINAHSELPSGNPVTAQIVKDELARHYTRIGKDFLPPKKLHVYVRNDQLGR